MLQATVQTSMKKFIGKPRVAGEVIAGEELATVSRTVIDALVNQKILVLSEEGVDPAGNDGERLQHMQAQVDALREALPAAVAEAIAPLKAQLAALCDELGVKPAADSETKPRSGARKAKEA